MCVLLKWHNYYHWYSGVGETIKISSNLNLSYIKSNRFLINFNLLLKLIDLINSNSFCQFKIQRYKNDYISSLW